MNTLIAQWTGRDHRNQARLDRIADGLRLTLFANGVETRRVETTAWTGDKGQTLEWGAMRLGESGVAGFVRVGDGDAAMDAEAAVAHAVATLDGPQRRLAAGGAKAAEWTRHAESRVVSGYRRDVSRAAYALRETIDEIARDLAQRYDGREADAA